MAGKTGNKQKKECIHIGCEQLSEVNPWSENPVMKDWGWNREEVVKYS